MTLFWRVLLSNAAVLVVASLALVLTPATVSWPIALQELVFLSIGTVLLLVVNYAVLRRVLAPLTALARFMGEVDPLRPGRRPRLDRSVPDIAAVADAFDETLARLEAERRESGRRAQAAQEGERRRVSRDLHDQVGQALTAALLELEQGRDEASARGREAVRAALEDVRAVARGLRPQTLDDLGLASALRALALEIERAAGIAVHREIAAEVAGVLDEERELAVFRVAQESLTNAARHARARDVHLRAALDGAELVLEIADDGAGFDPGAVAPGGGLQAIRERAMLAGAAVAIDSAPGAGTRVRLSVPVAEEGR